MTKASGTLQVRKDGTTAGNQFSLARGELRKFFPERNGRIAGISTGYNAHFQLIPHISRGTMPSSA